MSIAQSPHAITMSSPVGPPLGPLYGARDSRGAYWIRLPFDTQAGQDWLRHFCASTDEFTLLDRPNRTAVWVRTDTLLDPRAVRLQILQIVRRDSYFRAVLLHSRGDDETVPCTHKCNNPSQNSRPRFRECRTVPGFQNGACSCCVWQSHGRQCQHWTAPVPAPGGGNGGDDDDDGNNDDDDESWRGLSPRGSDVSMTSGVGPRGPWAPRSGSGSSIGSRVAARPSRA